MKQFLYNWLMKCKYSYFVVIYKIMQLKSWKIAREPAELLSSGGCRITANQDTNRGSRYNVNHYAVLDSFERFLHFHWMESIMSSFRTYVKVNSLTSQNYGKFCQWQKDYRKSCARVTCTPAGGTAAPPFVLRRRRSYTVVCCRVHP